MQINVQQYLDRVAAGEVRQLNETATPASVQTEAGIAAALTPLAAAVRKATAAGELISATLTITTPEVTTVTLETGVVNLPLANFKKVSNFLEVEEIVPVNIYLIVANRFLNASGLRIDKLATADDFESQSQLLADAAVDVLNKLQHIAEEAAKPAPEPEPEKPVVKKTTRKTATKKPAAKKTTAAAKKPAAKKTTAAAKKPAAKKAPVKRASTKKTEE